MDTLMEFSIQGDIFFFYDTLSDEEKETVRKCMREKYKYNYGYHILQTAECVIQMLLITFQKL